MLTRKLPFFLELFQAFGAKAHTGKLLKVGFKGSEGTLGAFLPAFTCNTPSMSALTPMNRTLAAAVTNICHTSVNYTI